MKTRYGRKIRFTTPPVGDELTLAWKDHFDVVAIHSAGLDLSMYILLLTNNVKRYALCGGVGRLNRTRGRESVSIRLNGRAYTTTGPYVWRLGSD